MREGREGNPTHALPSTKAPFSTIRNNHLKLSKHLTKSFRKSLSCEKQFRVRADLKQHIVTHSDDRPFSCQKCDKSFKYSQSRNQHMKRHELGLTFVCEKCPNTYNSRQGLHQHKKSRHEKITEVKTNDEPNYKSSHVDTYIEEDKPAVESNNINFEEIEKRSVQKKYLCELCDKTYNTRQGLHFHSKHTHEGIKYVCNQCDFKAKHHVTLKTHIKSEHEGIEYACNQCEYRCKWKKNVRLHTIKMH